MNARLFAAATLLSAAVAVPALAQDAPTTGEGVFNQKCKACHAPANGVARGPALKGVVGRKIASVSGYEYSDGLKAKASEKWTEKNLDAYLTDPKAFAPGGKMPTKLADDAQRKLVIGYLKTMK